MAESNQSYFEPNSSHTDNGKESFTDYSQSDGIKAGWRKNPIIRFFAVLIYAWFLLPVVVFGLLIAIHATSALAGIVGFAMVGWAGYYFLSIKPRAERQREPERIE